MPLFLHHTVNIRVYQNYFHFLPSLHFLKVNLSLCKAYHVMYLEYLSYYNSFIQASRYIMLYFPLKKKNIKKDIVCGIAYLNELLVSSS